MLLLEQILIVTYSIYEQLIYNITNWTTCPNLFLALCALKLNVADFKRILEIYNEHVFQKLWKNNSQQLPKMFMGSFLRLKYKMEICETEGSQTLSLCGEENLKTIEDTIKMLQPKSLLKAQSEFRQVLVWISIAMDKRRTHEIH
uniref:Interleukin 26 n=1 Tax=Cyprinus carpio TaxID=7962 RepID=A0A8C1WAW7_CYPCA